MKRILISQTAFLGDLILTSPLIKSVKRTFPESEIFLLVRKGLKGVFEGFPYVDGIIERKDKGILKASRKLKGMGFDLAISPHRSHRTSLTLFLSGIGERVGFDTAGFSFLYTRRVNYRPVHEVERNLDLLRAVSENPVIDGEVELPMDGELYRETLRKFSLTEKSYITLSPGSVWATKRWLPEYFAEVGRHFLRRGLEVVILGSEADRDVCSSVSERLKGGINLCGKTDLKELMAVIKGAKLSIVNDSAPAHIATAFRTPVVSIFGSTVKEFGFYPLGERARVAEVDLYCRPCGIHGKRSCPEKHFRCMRDLKPQAVIEISEELLGEERWISSQS